MNYSNNLNDRSERYKIKSVIYYYKIKTVLWCGYIYKYLFPFKAIIIEKMYKKYSKSIKINLNGVHFTKVADIMSMVT